MNNAKQTISLLESLGFIINYEKSKLTPSQKCTFLGLCLNSEKMQIELTTDKRLNISKLINKYQKIKRCKIRDFASFIGSLGFCCQATIYGWVYLKNFEREKVRALEKYHGNYEVVIEINSELNADFKWWKDNIVKLHFKLRSRDYIYTTCSIFPPFARRHTILLSFYPSGEGISHSVKPSSSPVTSHSFLFLRRVRIASVFSLATTTRCQENAN